MTPTKPNIDEAIEKVRNRLFHEYLELAYALDAPPDVTIEERAEFAFRAATIETRDCAYRAADQSLLAGGHSFEESVDKQVWAGLLRESHVTARQANARAQQRRRTNSQLTAVNGVKDAVAQSGSENALGDSVAV